MPSSEIAYPSSLPVPQTSTVTPAERRALSDSDRPREARAIQRERLEYERLTWPPMPLDKCGVFRNWWRDELIYGGAWFTATWPLPRGMVSAVRKFREQPKWVFVPGGFWRISALCETRSRIINERPDVIFTTFCRIDVAIPPVAVRGISWSVAGADTVSISGGVGSVASTGSFDGDPDTTYTITATNAHGSTVVSVTTDPALYRNGESYFGQPLYDGPTPDAVAEQVAEWYCVVNRGSTVVNYTWEEEFYSMRVLCADTALSSQIGVNPVCE